MSQPRSQRVGLVGENPGNEVVDVKAWSITLNPCCVTLQVNTTRLLSIVIQIKRTRNWRGFAFQLLV